MLLGLSIRNVVLIDQLDLSFNSGLTVLTGETGAGKSILLDSLGLALGARAESGLLRAGTAQLSVTAEFVLAKGHPVHVLLDEHGYEASDSLALRRVIGADGRSRAFVNDQPVSVSLLNRLGEALVEIHGQFESHSLLDAATHRGALDAFARLDGAAVRSAWSTWREASRAREDAAATLAKARSEGDFLRHATQELADIDPKPGEEEDLAKRRAFLMEGEKVIEALNASIEALSQRGDVETNLRAAQRALERIADKAQGRLDAAMGALDRAAIEAAEARALLEKEASGIDLDGGALDKVEERLFALRAAARKHGVAVDKLADFRAKLESELTALDAGDSQLLRLAATEKSARESFVVAAEALSKKRTAASRKLDSQLTAELPPLKLEKARFHTKLEPLPEADWNESGADRVVFEVATNPGAAPGPLGRIASGGELSRFMLALKVVLARTGTTPTMVFDEVDSGVGGAVAAAVGERLARLAETMQILVVTHSPQVAARGGTHLLIAKKEAKGSMSVNATSLDAPARREEIARMLAGAQVTDQARAAADSLLAAAG